MIAWQTIASAVFVVLGIACCGISAISLALASTTRDQAEAAKVSDEGTRFAFLALVLIALASAVSFL